MTESNRSRVSADARAVTNLRRNEGTRGYVCRAVEGERTSGRVPRSGGGDLSQ